MKMDKLIAKTSKRKKKRTRRNLDEIRRRTLQVHYNNSNESICKLTKPKVTSFITASRLTLANKAIRSETVTRTLLFNPDKEKNKNVIELPDREKGIDTKVLTVNYKKDTIPFKLNSLLKNPICNPTGIDNHNTADSIILFSSLETEKVLNNTTINNVLSDSSSSVSLSSVIENDNSLYSEFMTNIVNYVQECASDFFKTNIYSLIKDNFLTKFLIPSAPNHINNNEVKIKLTTGNDVSIDKYLKSQNNIIKQYSLEQSWNDPSPIFHESYKMNFQKSLLSSSPAFSGEDSPEYFYYPHRLNQ